MSRRVKLGILHSLCRDLQDRVLEITPNPTATDRGKTRCSWKRRNKVFTYGFNSVNILSNKFYERVREHCLLVDILKLVNWQVLNLHYYKVMNLTNRFSDPQLHSPVNGRSNNFRSKSTCSVGILQLFIVNDNIVYSWNLNPGRFANRRPDLQIFLTQVVKQHIHFLPVFRNRANEMQCNRKKKNSIWRKSL